MRLNEDALELVSGMTVEEVARQLKYNADPVDRLNIPAYNWWNEALHGLARSGVATVFPQAIGLAAMFDEDLLHDIACVIATEARAKYNEISALGDRDIYKGLTMWSPNINIFRDQRWGRGHETYGEDPYLTSVLGVAFIKGLQGDENYPSCDSLKVAACAKHYAVHSGPEGDRHHFNAVASEKDMEETYLPAFEAAVRLGKVEAVMGAYNRTNGEPCCGSKTLINDILREKWGFEGHFVSDCWAVRDFHENHKITNNPAESAAMALNAGCDLNCGNAYLCILGALKDGLVKEKDMRRACVRLMKTRMKLGILDRSDRSARLRTAGYDAISFLENDSASNNALSLKASQRSIVLLENKGVLPIKDGEYETIGVIGPMADLRSVLIGNYFGTSSTHITNLEGIREATSARVLYSEGAHLYKDSYSNLSGKDDRLAEALAVTGHSDIIFLCLGLDATLEGEEGDTGNMFASGDKVSLLLPQSQIRLATAVVSAAREQGKKVVVILNAGSAIDISFIKDDVDAVVDCWYSGGFGGRALGDVLFGKVNPSGRLPITFYKDGDQPDFADYSMKGRTYRYFKGEALYPFGYGLSYTTFKYEMSGFYEVSPVFGSDAGSDAGACVRVAASGDYIKMQEPVVRLNIEITNTGERDGEDSVLVFVDKWPEEKMTNGLSSTEYLNSLDPADQPIKSLCAFKHVALAAGEKAVVPIDISLYSLTTVLEDGRRVFLPGRYIFTAGDATLELNLI